MAERERLAARIAALTKENRELRRLAAVQKQAEEESRFAKFTVDRAADAIYWIDPQANILDVNQAACAMLGYSKEELCAMTVHDINPRFQADMWPGYWEKLKQQGSSSFETCHQTKHGQLIPIEVHANHLFYEGNEYHCTFVRNIAERKRVEAELRKTEEHLRQSQKMEAVGRLAGGIAHDFNNLLTVINGYSEELLRHDGTPEFARKAMEQILASGRRAAELTSQLLAFSRKQVLQPKPMNLNVSVLEIEMLLRRLIGEDITLDLVLDPRVATIKADPHQIEQVLMNLAINARDAMPQGGRLVMTTSVVRLDEAFLREHDPGLPSGAYVLLEVRDTGVGIDPAMLAQIFDPFFTTKGVGKGTGLGLSTVHGIVRQSGGVITVASRRGTGTTFRLYFPVVGEAVPSVEAPPDALPIERGAETILLVEDEPSVRTLVRAMLSAEGYRVLEAETAESAIELSDGYASPIHLLITDVVLPRVRGGALAQQLSLRRSEMKILLMSGYLDPIRAEETTLMARLPFLQKPFTRASFLQRVRAALESD